MKRNYLIGLCLLVSIFHYSCSHKNDNFLLDFEIGFPYESNLAEKKEQNILRHCTNNLEKNKSPQYYRIIHDFQGQSLLTNHFFNLGFPKEEELKIHTVHINGSFYNEQPMIYHQSCLQLENEINMRDVLAYLIEIYGAPLTADSGSISRNPFGVTDILNPIFIEPYRETIYREDPNWGKVIEKIGTTDFLYRWDLPNMDVELIRSQRSSVFIANNFIVINYKEKNFNSKYQKKTDSIKKNYRLDDFVHFNFTWGDSGYRIRNTGSFPWDKVIEIEISTITRTGIFEPRNITNLQFDILFVDEFENVLHSINDLKWEEEVKFEMFPMVKGLVYGFEYNSRHPDNSPLNRLENRRNRATMRPRVTAIRFADGEVIRSY